MDRFISRVIGAAMLDVATYEEIEADRNATGQAMLVVVLVSLGSGLVGLRGGFFGLITGTLAALVGWVIFAGLAYLIGTKLLPEPTTRADLGQLLRVLGFASAPGVLRAAGIVPCLGWIVAVIASVWQLVAFVVAVRQGLDYTSTARAVGVCLIGWVIYLVLATIVTMLGLGGAAIAGGTPWH